MGNYLNPGNGNFYEAVNSEIYVDKTGLISYTNRMARTKQKYICVSKPRRFGKSTDIDMLTAYYQKGIDSKALFAGLEIEKSEGYEQHLNCYNVINLNMDALLREAKQLENLSMHIDSEVKKELYESFPEISYFRSQSISSWLSEAYRVSGAPFAIVIDDWDAPFREYKGESQGHLAYLDYLKQIIKDKSYIALAYITGLYPVRKASPHASLNFFDEFSMADAGGLGRFFGFTEGEVKSVSEQSGESFKEMKKWFEGYSLNGADYSYNPYSVVTSALRRYIGSYWPTSMPNSLLQEIISLGFEGLRNAVISLTAGRRVNLSISGGPICIASPKTKAEALELLVHLGYLAFDKQAQEAYVPNREATFEFIKATEGLGWQEVICALKAAESLLEATWKGDSKLVAKHLKDALNGIMPSPCENLQQLADILLLAYSSSKDYYTITCQAHESKGMVEAVFLPFENDSHKPPMHIEARLYEKARDAALEAKSLKTPESLTEYKGRILSVSAYYGCESREVSCIIKIV